MYAPSVVCQGLYGSCLTAAAGRVFVASPQTTCYRALPHCAHTLLCTASDVQMRQIPGVGPYTAAAVASIAFSDPAAAVDGNVIRVISRLRALKGNPTKMAKIWDRLAAELLHTERPGCHNQVGLSVGWA